MHLRRILLLLAFGALNALTTPFAWAGNSPAPPLMLANVYRPGMPLADYWVSEKYDGVRGYWDGQQLRTRGGEVVNTPAWFTAGWPATPLDGELWAGRGKFSLAVATVRQQTPSDAAWRNMRFMVFDLPAQGGPFTDRIPVLSRLLATLAVPWVQPVAQRRVVSSQALQTLLTQTVALGGEGLMLHRGASLYRAQRSDDLLKVKTYEDAEARVIAHIPGKGKYTGVLGALLVQMPDDSGRPGRRFKLGTGLSNAQRKNPPAVGSLVTYRFRGLTDGGLPRFASFMRVREDI